MAVNEKHVLDLSGSGIKKLEKRDGVGFKQLILDNNELTKLENLDCFPDLEKVSAAGNVIVRMYGISKCHHIIHLNLPNNHIVCIEGLKDMPNLTFLNLSVNNLKVIQNLQYSTNLTHLDLSRNNITALADISFLAKLQTLHLNGNKISSLTRASTYLPSSICILSLADNLISDLNEVSNLVKLECLEQLTIIGNPCLLAEESTLPSFDYRPFIINWCLGLRLLDGIVASQKESLKAEWIYSQGKGRHFKPGEHAELIEYLSQVCPVTADQTAEDEDEKLLRILHKQRQHKEQFLNEMSQSQIIQSETSNIGKLQNKNSMTQSYHFKTDTSSIKNPESEIPENINVIPSKIMYESAPEVLFHSSPPDMAQSCHPSFQSGRYPRSVSKSEILHNSVKSPITIEQVELETSPKAKAQEVTKSPYQHYEDRRVRPSSSSEIRPTHTPKGTLIRKVSKRAPSPSSATPPGCRSRLPHSTSKSRISPSRSCILTARLTAAAKNSSESDTSEELSQANRTPQRHFRSLSSDTQSGNNSPILQQKYSSTTVSPTKRSFMLESNTEPVSLNTSIINNMGVSSFSPRMEKPKTLFDVYGKSEEDLVKAATKIQSVWRGYYVRHHNPRVFKMLQEIRFRRLEDHIQHLHGHLCRLTDFVLRQQQDLQHERELRKMQAEDIRHLHEKAKDLQRSVSVVVSKAKTNIFQNLSEHDPSNRDSTRDGSVTSESKFEKQLSTPSSESLNLALRYSTQMYQENSGLYSPSSQTSSVTSSIPDTYGRQKSRRDLPPSASDMSDADSGLQSMVSPNVATTENERQAVENEHATMNGYGHEVNSYLCKKDVLDCLKKGSSKIMGNYYEKESPFDDSPTCNSKLGMLQAKSFRQAAPLATISSSGENASLMHANHIPNRLKMPLKNTFVEYPLSSVENSPSSVFPPLPPDNPMNPLMRTNSDSFVLSRQQHVHSNLISPSCLPSSKRRSLDTSSESLADSAAAKNLTCSETAQGCCSKSCVVHHKTHAAHVKNIRSSAQHVCKHVGKTESDNSSAKRCPLRPKNINHLAQNKMSLPLDEIESPSSPCTVEMSGCISHSCSFQSDGYAAEEVSATATVKLFSSRAVSMTCTNGTLSPQASTQRPLSLSDASPQANLRSPLVLAASVWEKKVQDIESTFHQLQTQIRDLEGAFGQIGQFGQFFYPGILQDDPKELRPAINCAEPTSGALVLDMPKINFKCSENCNPDKLFQSRLSGNVSSLPLTSAHLQNGTNQNCDDCRVEELDQPTVDETAKLTQNDSSENKE